MHGATPLFVAAELRDSKMVRFLLEVRLSLLPSARRCRNTGVVGINSSSFSSPCLWPRRGCSQGGADPNTGRHDGRTPLSAAARHADVPVTRLLLGAKADANKASERGDTALHIASELGHGALVRVLLQEGHPDVAVVNMRRKGATPLHFAAANGHLAVVRALLEAAPDDIDARQSDGITPLFLAAREGNHELVRLLLQQVSPLRSVPPRCRRRRCTRTCPSPRRPHRLRRPAVRG